MQHVDERHRTAVDGLVELLVDEVVSEVDVARILFGVAVLDAFEVSPVDGAEAHGAGLA